MRKFGRHVAESVACHGYGEEKLLDSFVSDNVTGTIK